MKPKLTPYALAHHVTHARLRGSPSELTHWSITPAQLPAMQRQLTRTILLHSADGVKDLQCVKDWAARTAAACLRSLALVAPADRKSRK